MYQSRWPLGGLRLPAFITASWTNHGSSGIASDPTAACVLLAIVSEAFGELDRVLTDHAYGLQRVAASGDRKVTFCPLPSAVLAPVFLQVRQKGLRLKDSKDRPTKAVGSATGPMTINGLKWLKQAGDRADVDVKVGTSILRPTFSIREQLLGRLPDHRIAEQMGHFSGSTSLLRRVYVPTHLPSAPNSEEAPGNLRRQAAARAGAAPSRPVAAELTYSQLDRLQVHLRKYLEDSTEETSTAIVQEWEPIAGFRLNARKSATQTALLLNEAGETTWDVSRRHPFVSGGHSATIKDALIFVRAGGKRSGSSASMPASSPPCNIRTTVPLRERRPVIETPTNVQQRHLRAHGWAYRVSDGERGQSWAQYIFERGRNDPRRMTADRLNKGAAVIKVLQNFAANQEEKAPRLPCCRSFSIKGKHEESLADE